MVGRQIQIYLTKQDSEELFEAEFRPLGAVIVPYFARTMDEHYEHVSDYYDNCDRLRFLLVRRDMLPTILRTQVPSGLAPDVWESPLIEAGPSGNYDGRLHRTRMYYVPTAVGNPAVHACAVEEFPAWAEKLFRRTRKVLEKRRMWGMVCYLGPGAVEFERQGGELAMN